MTNKSISISHVHSMESVLMIQKKAYTENFWESSKTFENLHIAFPDGNRLLYYDNKPIGYIFFHPFYLDVVKDLYLDEFFLTGKEDCMYLHDMTIDPEYQKKGFAEYLITYFNNISREHNLYHQALMAVQKSQRFWQKYGFKNIKDVDNYGGKGFSGCYMKKIL